MTGCYGVLIAPTSWVPFPPIPFLHHASLNVFVCFAVFRRSNSTNRSSLGQYTDLLSSSLSAASSLSASVNAAISRDVMSFQCFSSSIVLHPVIVTRDQCVHFIPSSVLFRVMYLHDHNIAHRDLKYVAPPLYHSPSRSLP